MTATPTPKFVPRPDPPAINTEEYTRWTKERSISFKGGTLTAAYGNLVQTWNMDGIGFSCIVDSIDVSVPPATVTRTIGGASTQRAGYQYSKKQFNKKNSSLAAAGKPVRIVTAVGEYTARLSGSMDALVKFICSKPQALYDRIYVYSPRGAEYGPFIPLFE